MEYVIGLDGGGTKTHLAAADRRMNMLFEAYGGSSNLTSLSAEAVERNLRQLLSGFFAESGFRPEDCRGVCLGSAGAGRDSARTRLASMLREAGARGEITVVNDAQGALAGATETGIGILLIAGTGSICYGKNSEGKTWRTGGWGHVAGDEGSGYDMACKILQAVARAADGRGEPTLLTELVEGHWKLTGMDDLVDAVYRSGKGKSEIAALAPLCGIACDRGDPVACRIMEDCAASLAEMAAVTAEHLWDAGEAVPCFYGGGLLESSPRLRQCLQAHLCRRRADMQLLPCRHDAAWGCALMAWQFSAENI